MLTVGSPAPQFSGNDIFTNDPFALADQRGKIVVIGFHGVAYCPPCYQTGVPGLQELWATEYQHLPNVQFVVVSVNEDNDEGQIDNALNLFNIDVSTPWLVDNSIQQAYQVNGTVPYYVLVDADGLVCDVHPGIYGPDIEAHKQGIRDAIDDCIPEDPFAKFDRHWRAVATILFGVTNDGGGLIISGGKPIPVPPWDPLHLSRAKRDLLTGLAAHELGERLQDERARHTLQKGALEAIRNSVKEIGG